MGLEKARLRRRELKDSWCRRQLDVAGLVGAAEPAAAPAGELSRQLQVSPAEAVGAKGQRMNECAAKNPAREIVRELDSVGVGRNGQAISAPGHLVAQRERQITSIHQ